MDLILLPGNNPSNQEWIEEVELCLKDMFEKTLIQYYDHWEGISESFDMASELSKLRENVSGKTNYGVFAKSVGTMLTLNALDKNIIKPKFIVFVGTPVNWQLADNLNIIKIIEKFTFPILFIQQEFDKYLHASELAHVLKNIALKNFKLETVEGSDHTYEDTSLLKQLIDKFIKMNRLN